MAGAVLITRYDGPVNPHPAPVKRSANSRRTSNRVRVALAHQLGSDLDGAWWPFTRSMGRELPDLVEALTPVIGEVVDIQLNWTAESRTPVLSTMSPAAAAQMGWSATQQRVMSLTGRTTSTRILVVPAMTPEPLALMVLRRASGRPVAESDYGTAVFEASERVVRAARVALAAQSSQTASP